MTERDKLPAVEYVDGHKFVPKRDWISILAGVLGEPTSWNIPFFGLEYAEFEVENQDEGNSTMVDLYISRRTKFFSASDFAVSFSERTRDDSFLIRHWEVEGVTFSVNNVAGVLRIEGRDERGKSWKRKVWPKQKE